MIRRVVVPAVSAALALTVSACATHRASVDVSPQVASQMRSTYACVVDAFQTAGYPVVTNEEKLNVHGQIRDEVSSGDPAVQGSNVGGAGFGVERKPADEGTPFTVDGVSGGVKIDEATGRVVVVAGGYTGAGLTRKSGYVSRPASARGNTAVNNAKACARGEQSSD